MIKVVSGEELSSNPNIFSELVTEILRLLPRQLRYGQEGIDLLGLLLAPQVLQRDVLQSGHEVSGEVPTGGAVDEIPLLRVDLPAVGLLGQLGLRHGPGGQTVERRDLTNLLSPVPDTEVCYDSYEGVLVEGVSADYQDQLLTVLGLGEDVPVVSA